jgi:hypothetical protein
LPSLLRASGALAIAGLLCACTASHSVPASDQLIPDGLGSSARTLPQNLRGITYDDISSHCATTQAQLKTEQLLKQPTVRVVFDPIKASCYATAVPNLDRYGYTMGELVDSSSMKRYSLSQVRSRVKDYVTTLGAGIDLWEIGNEVNGEWLSHVKCPTQHECAAQAHDVTAKVEAMYDAVSAKGYPTELTLYYQGPKTVTPGYEMLPWEQTYVPSRMHAGLRYVLVSYYEDGNNGIRPSHAELDSIFGTLAHDFPNASVGFGEIGMAHPIAQSSLSKAEDIFSYYQTLSFASVPSYTRAGFWWYSAEDLVPSTKWPAFFAQVQAKL